MDKKKAAEKYLNQHALHMDRACPYCNGTQSIDFLGRDHGEKTFLCRDCNKKWKEVWGWVEVFELRDIDLETD